MGRTYANNTDTEGHEDYSSNRATLDVDAPLGTHTLSAVTNYSNYRSNQTLWGPPGYLRIHATRNEEVFGEVRLASPTKQLVEYIVGASYLHERLKFDVYQKAGLSLGFFPRSGEVRDFAIQDTDSLSPFAQLAFNPTSTISVIGSARYTHQRRSAVLERVILVPGNLTTTTPAFPSTRVSLLDKTLDGSGTLQWRPSDKLNFYASYGKGSKGAGFITQPTTPGTAQFAGERAYTWEAGAKVRGDWGHLNASVFDIKIAGFQQVVFDGTRFVTLNVPLTSRGAEGEIELRLAPRLRLTGNGVYARVRRTDTNTGMSYSPPFTATAETPVGGGLNIALNAGLFYRDAMRLRPQLPANTVPPAPAYTLVHARIALKSVDRGWEVAVLGRNLTNAYAITGGYPSVPSSTSNTAAVERPRTIALQFTLRR